MFAAGASSPRGWWERRPRLVWIGSAAALLLAALVIAVPLLRDRKTEEPGAVGSSQASNAAGPARPAGLDSSAGSADIGGTPGSGSAGEGGEPGGAAALATAREELLAIKEAWQKGEVTPEEVAARIRRFQQAHREPLWRDPSENLLREVEKSVASALLAASVNLRNSYNKEVVPLVEQGDFQRGLELLATMADLQPALAAELAAEIEGRAASALEKARLDAAELARKAEFDAARQLLVGQTAKLPKSLAAERRSAIEAIDGQATSYGEEARQLATAAQEAHRALTELDFASAERAVGGVAGISHPLLATKRADLEREVEAIQDLARKLQGVPEGGTESKSGAALAQTLAAMSDAALQERLGSSAGAADASSQEASTQEALGLLLLHIDGPGRAWSLLVNERLGAEKKADYAVRLAVEVSRRVRPDLEALRERLRSLSHSADAGKATAWQEQLVAAEKLLEGTRRLTEDPEVRADAAALWLACKRFLLRASLPNSLFHASKVETRPAGTVRLTYDFRSEEQLADFTPVGPTGNVLVLEKKGLASMKGQYRYLRGNPFRQRLAVAATVASFSQPAPNINVGLWTWEGCALPAEVGYSSVASVTESPTALLLGLGYKAKTSSTSNGMPYLDCRGDEAFLPCNVILEARRTLGAPGARLTCLWGRRPVKPLRAPFVFEILSDAQGQLAWKAMGDLISPASSESFLPPGTREGCVTFHSMSSRVLYAKLQIEGELNPPWIGEELQRQALSALQLVEPDYPFLNLVRPEEDTVRGHEDLVEPNARRLLYDGFKDGFAQRWKVLNEDKTHHSLAKRPGALVITTQRGGFAGSTKSYKNLFLIECPAAPGEDFEVTTRILGFKPHDSFQQACLVCFDDDDNYVKASFERARGKRRFVLLKEAEGRTSFVEADAPPELKTVWLRLRKQGSSYSYLTSVDGETYTLQHESIGKATNPRFVGLTAKNSETDAPELDATFDFFEVSSLGAPR